MSTLLLWRDGCSACKRIAPDASPSIDQVRVAVTDPAKQPCVSIERTLSDPRRLVRRKSGLHVDSLPVCLDAPVFTAPRRSPKRSKASHGSQSTGRPALRN